MVATKQLVHVPDYADHLAYQQRDPGAVNFVEVAGVRTLVVVPMLKEDELIGTIQIYRQEVQRHPGLYRIDGGWRLRRAV